ncbi:hypothetical protein HRG_012880 [Hirsutella rhossiliensis]
MFSIFNCRLKRAPPTALDFTQGLQRPRHSDPPYSATATRHTATPRPAIQRYSDPPYSDTATRHTAIPRPAIQRYRDPPYSDTATRHTATQRPAIQRHSDPPYSDTATRHTATQRPAIQRYSDPPYSDTATRHTAIQRPAIQRYSNRAIQRGNQGPASTNDTTFLAKFSTTRTVLQLHRSAMEDELDKKPEANAS